MNLTVNLSVEIHFRATSEELDARTDELDILLFNDNERSLEMCIWPAGDGFAVEVDGAARPRVLNRDGLHRAFLQAVADAWPEAAGEPAVHRIANRLHKLVGVLD